MWAKAVKSAEPEELCELYSSLRLALVYNRVERSRDAEVDPLIDRVVKVCARGATHTLTTHLALDGRTTFQICGRRCCKSP